MLRMGSGCREEDNETVEGIDGCGVGGRLYC